MSLDPVRPLGFPPLVTVHASRVVDGRFAWLAIFPCETYENLAFHRGPLHLALRPHLACLHLALLGPAARDQERRCQF